MLCFFVVCVWWGKEESDSWPVGEGGSVLWGGGDGKFAGGNVEGFWKAG